MSFHSIDLSTPAMYDFPEITPYTSAFPNTQCPAPPASPSTHSGSPPLSLILSPSSEPEPEPQPKLGRTYPPVPPRLHPSPSHSSPSPPLSLTPSPPRSHKNGNRRRRSPRNPLHRPTLHPRQTSCEATHRIPSEYPNSYGTISSSTTFSWI